LVKFAAIPFSELLRTTQETDVLVGVHGAGLTHSIFMREGASALSRFSLVNWNTPVLVRFSTMRGLLYFYVHAASVEKGQRRGRRSQDNSDSRDIEKRDSWHVSDVYIEPTCFLDVVESAIKSMYSKGQWNNNVTWSRFGYLFLASIIYRQLLVTGTSGPTA
jgi:protein O-GlcNAc transferase